MSRFLGLDEVWGGSRETKVKRSEATEARGAQQPKLMHREEVGGCTWVGM